MCGSVSSWLQQADVRRRTLRTSWSLSLRLGAESTWAKSGESQPRRDSSYACEDALHLLLLGRSDVRTAATRTVVDEPVMATRLVTEETNKSLDRMMQAGMLTDSYACLGQSSLRQSSTHLTNLQKPLSTLRRHRCSAATGQEL